MNILNLKEKITNAFYNEFNGKEVDKDSKILIERIVSDVLFEEIGKIDDWDIENPAGVFQC